MKIHLNTHLILIALIKIQFLNRVHIEDFKIIYYFDIFFSEMFETQDHLVLFRNKENKIGDSLCVITDFNAELTK